MAAGKTERVGYSADSPSPEARWGIRPGPLQEWVQQNREQRASASCA